MYHSFTPASIEPNMFDKQFIQRIDKRTKENIQTEEDVYKLIIQEHPTLTKPNL